MLPGKENLKTPKVNDARKRSSLQSPYTAATPSTRPAPKKIGKPLHELGDQNLDATAAIDETFNLSCMKAQLDETVVKDTSMMAEVCVGDANIEESFLERTMMRDGIKDARRVLQRFDATLNASAFGTSLRLPEELNIPLNKPVNKCDRFARLADPNLDETAADSTLCDMDVTQTNVTANNILREMLRLDDSQDKTLEHEEPLLAQPPAERILEKTLCEAATQDATPPPPSKALSRGDAVHAVVQAVVVCERQSGSVNLDEGASLASEIKELEVQLDEASGTEIEGSVNVSVLSLPVGTPEKDLPCVSDRPSDFSFSAAVKSSHTEEEKLQDVDISAICGNPDDTELVFRGCIQQNIDEALPADFETSAYAEQDDTLMVFQTAKDRDAIGDVFPAHYGSAEVDARPSSRPDSVATAIALEASLESDFFETADENMDIVHECEGEVTVMEDKSDDAVPQAVAGDNIECQQSGDLAFEECDIPPVEDVLATAARRTSFKVPLSPKDNASRSGVISPGSSAPSYMSPSPSTGSQRRKYNMNDSEISFLLNEVKAYDIADRQSSTSPCELQRLTKNLAQLETEKAELHNKVRALTTEMETYKQKVATKDSALVDASRKVAELEKAKENAEKSVTDYEFVMEDVKKRHAKQKAELQAKLIAQEEEIEKLVVQQQQQAETSCTAAGLAADLALTNERLCMAEAAREAAEKRCEELMRELEFASKSAVTTYALSEEIAAKNQDLAAALNKVQLLEEQIREKDEALLAAKERGNEDYIKLQEKLNETAFALEKSEESVAELKNQLNDADSEKSLLREIQVSSEMELMKLRDELKAVQEAFEKSELSCTKARLQRSEYEEELATVRAQLDDKSAQLNGEVAKTVDLQSKCKTLEERLVTEQLARDVATRELAELREDILTLSETLDKAKSALQKAEERAAAAEKDLAEHVRCHTEELNSRVGELENAVAAYIAEKTALSAQLEQQQQKEQATIEELRKSNEMVAKLEADMSFVRDENYDLLAELERGKQLYEAKALESEKVKSDFGVLQSSMSVLESESSLLKEELEAANEKLRLSEASSAETIESLKSEIAKLTNQRDYLNNQLAEAEELRENIEKHMVELRLSVTEKQAELMAFASMKEKLETEWQSKEKDYLRRILAAENAISSIPELESTVQQLKTEAHSLSEELCVANKRLLSETELKEKASDALGALEKEYSSLKQAKKEMEKEYEEAKLRFDLEICSAKKIAGELKEEVKNLEDRLTIEESAAKVKLDAVSSEVTRLEAELEENKLAQAEAERQLTEFSVRSHELLLEKQSLETRLAEALASAQAESSRVDEKEMKELRRLLEIKTREVNRLGDLCDEFDEIEADYRQKVFSLIRERDELKAQLDPSSVPVVPNLRAALHDGVKMLSPDVSLAQNDGTDSKLKQLEQKLLKLTEEKVRLEKMRSLDEKQREELRMQCKAHEKRILELEKICDEADASEEGLRSRIAELEKEIAVQKGILPIKTTGPCLLDALRESERSPDAMDEHYKEDAYESAPTSPHLQRSLETAEGALYEDSRVEGAPTPNRTLHTTLYKKMGKTPKLAETPEGKANTSRCAQQ